VIGPGRMGGAMASALATAGWEVAGLLGRDDDIGGAAAGVDLLLIATPDAAIADVAAAVEPSPATVVAHLAGSLGLAPLALHPRQAAIHPLVAAPTAELGAARLLGARFAVAGDPLALEIVADLGGRALAIEDDQRAAYHAAACIASNHVVALLGQVERVAATVGLGLDDYLDLVRDAVDSAATVGPRAALTGPAARGDHETIARHLAALAPDERPAYEALAALARRLAVGPS